jgi:hypothetical protein
LAPPPNLKAGGPPTVGCPRLIIQYIRSYPPYLQAVSSVRNLRTRHAVVTGDPPNMGLWVENEKHIVWKQNTLLILELTQRATKSAAGKKCSRYGQHTLPYLLPLAVLLIAVHFTSTRRRTYRFAPTTAHGILLGLFGTSL